MEWLEHLYESWRASCGLGNAIPNFAAFWDREELEFSPKQEEYVMLSAFRDDPEANPLPTPSGRIEIYCETIAGFGYDDEPAKNFS
jgi:biotin/methionine sulfoxide reductase